MDEYQIMALLGRIKPGNAERYTVTSLYAQTLAQISDHLTDDQLRRFLICGAYLCNKPSETAVEADIDPVDTYNFFKGRTDLH